MTQRQLDVEAKTDRVRALIPRNWPVETDPDGQRPRSLTPFPGSEWQDAQGRYWWFTEDGYLMNRMLPTDPLPWAEETFLLKFEPGQTRNEMVARRGMVIARITRLEPNAFVAEVSNGRARMLSRTHHPDFKTIDEARRWCDAGARRMLGMNPS
jgi:hypothetical protein